MSWIPIPAELASVVAFVAWVVGRLAGDQWVWTQWLFWIPSVAVLTISLLAAALASWAAGSLGRLRAGAQWSVVMVAALATLGSEVGIPWQSDAPPTGALRILQWNTNWPAGDDPRSVEALASVPADIVLISNRGAITSPDQVRLWAGPDARVTGAGPFALVTKVPVVGATQVAAGGGPASRWWVARFEVLPPGWSGRPLRIAMVDLPSRPSLPRSAVAQALLRACEAGSLGEVDVVAGDFNATDGSVILTRCFPDFRDAMREAGHGWLATWPRRFPLWRIDHVLLAPGISAMGGRVIDPGVGGHRMSEVLIAPR